MKHTTLCFVLLVVVLFCAFCDPQTGTFTISYKLRINKTDFTAAVHFMDMEGNDITEFDLDVTKDLTEPQVSFGVLTDMSIPFNLKLTFNCMRNAAQGMSFVGKYKAKVYRRTRDESSGNFIDVPVTNSNGDDASTADVNAASKSLLFSGVHNSVSENTYLIAFSFSDYLEQYSDGTYEGSIVLEVIPT